MADPTNDILPWGVDATEGENLTSQENYESSAVRTNGVTSGTASSSLYNKHARQSALISYLIAQFTCNQTGDDFLDDGDNDAKVTLFNNALTAFITAMGYASDSDLTTEINRAQGVEDLKAPIDSPSFTTAAWAPTPSTTDSSTRVANTAWVRTIANSIASSVAAELISEISGGTYDLSTTGSADMPSWFLGGMQFRWGRFTASANAKTSVSFKKAFSNSCFIAWCDGGRSSGVSNEDNEPRVITSSIDSEGFTVFSASNSTTSCIYGAFGK